MKVDMGIIPNYGYHPQHRRQSQIAMIYFDYLNSRRLAQGGRKFSRLTIPGYLSIAWSASAWTDLIPRAASFGSSKAASGTRATTASHPTHTSSTPCIISTTPLSGPKTRKEFTGSHYLNTLSFYYMSSHSLFFQTGESDRSACEDSARVQS